MVVAENIEDFEMEPEEAVADAIEQFESQGVDLSNIVKTKDGAKAGPVPALIERLDAAKDVGEAIAVLDELRTTVEASDDDRLIAGSNDACGSVFGCVGRIDRASCTLMAAALSCFASLSAFGTRGRLVIPLYPLAKPVLKMIFSTPELCDRNLWALACRVARQACARNEAAKHSLFLEYGFDGFVRTAIRRGLGWGSEASLMTGASAEVVRLDRRGRTKRLGGNCEPRMQAMQTRWHLLKLRSRLCFPEIIPRSSSLTPPSFVKHACCARHFSLMMIAGKAFSR